MPIVLHRTQHRDVQLGLWRIEESVDALMKLLQLDASELARLDAIKSEKKKLQWLASRCLIRRFVNTPEFISLKATSAGKPYFDALGHHVSISHSGNFAAAIVSASGNVGIDIEQTNANILVIRHKFINEQEIAFIPSDDALTNLIAWSSKETVFKWYGHGAVDFRKHITMHPFKPAARGVIVTAFAKPDCNKLLNVEFEVNAELVMTWTTGS